jgi:hypothetical protein
MPSAACIDRRMAPPRNAAIPDAQRARETHHDATCVRGVPNTSADTPLNATTSHGSTTASTGTTFGNDASITDCAACEDQCAQCTRATRPTHARARTFLVASLAADLSTLAAASMALSACACAATLARCACTRAHALTICAPTSNTYSEIAVRGEHDASTCEGVR